MSVWFGTREFHWQAGFKMLYPPSDFPVPLDPNVDTDKAVLDKLRATLRRSTGGTSQTVYAHNSTLHYTHDRSLVWTKQQLLLGTTITKKQRDVSAYNAFVTEKMGEINAGEYIYSYS